MSHVRRVQCWCLLTPPQIRQCFLNVFVQLLENYREFLILSEDATDALPFDTNGWLDTMPFDSRQFCVALSQTQMFSAPCGLGHAG